jgi:SAM-dependent methyltransferase
MSETKLNLGCGPCVAPGYTNLDLKTGTDARDLSAFATDSVDEVRASHLLEHFSHREAFGVMKEWVRVLKPGGRLAISVPDLDKIIAGYRSANSAKLPIEAIIMGAQVDADDYHKATYNRGKLEGMLRAAGVVRIETWKGDGDTSVHPVSLNLCGVKRAPRAEPPKVVFVLSCPRLGFNDMWMSVINGIKSVPNATVRKVTGAYWGQCLERGMTDAVAAGAEYVIALDYDSVYEPRDVQELMYDAESYPEADALTTLQSARGWDSPLVSLTGGDGKLRHEFDREEFSNPVTRINTAHFGLTLFRAASLAKLPHPWFLGVPAPDGTWSPGKMDDDIRFWHEWKKAGLSLYMANRISIGHMEPMVKWPGKDWQTVHQSLKDYNERGKPDEVWS